MHLQIHLEGLLSSKNSTENLENRDDCVGQRPYIVIKARDS